MNQIDPGLSNAISSMFDLIIRKIASTLPPEKQDVINYTVSAFNQSGFGAIASNLMTAARQPAYNGQLPQEVVQSTIQQWIDNVMQSYMQQLYMRQQQQQYNQSQQMYGRQQFGGYNQYSQPYYPQQPQAQYTFNPPPPPAPGQMTDNYARYSNNNSVQAAPPPYQAPIPPTANTTANNNSKGVVVPEDKSFVPQCIGTENITGLLTGTTSMIRVGIQTYLSVIDATMPPVSSFDAVVSAVHKLAGKNSFHATISTNLSKVVDVPSAAMDVAIQSITTALAPVLTNQDRSVTVVEKAVLTIVAEFMKNTSAPYKALSKLIIDEFNIAMRSGALFGKVIRGASIDSLDDIAELFNRASTIAAVVEWQKNPTYWDTLAAIANGIVVSAFTAGNIRLLKPTSDVNKRTIADALKDDPILNKVTKSGFSLTTSWDVLWRIATSEKTDNDVADSANDITASVASKSVFIVKRIYVVTDINPANFVSRDEYTAASINALVPIHPEAVNLVEYCFKPLTAKQRASYATVIGVMETKWSAYKFTVGVNNAGYVIASAPVTEE